MASYTGVLFKLKSILPLNIRLLTFNSLVLSHVNYASLVWGSTHKSKIDSIFAAQKRAMRAVMPGYVQYFYKDGNLPSHTKPAFTDLKILTVQNIILKNIMIFANKVYYYPHLLPPSVKSTFTDNGLKPDYSSNWYSVYNSIPFNTSTFFKGPLLYFHILSLSTDNELIQLNSPPVFKNRIKKTLLRIQGSGNPMEWEHGNFLLNNLPGARRSSRIQHQSTTS